MGGMSLATSRDLAFVFGRLLAEHKGASVVLLDLASQSGWTDWFVIATASSVTHLRGLARHVDEAAAAEGLRARRPVSIADDEEWVLLDYGDIVVHLMSERARAFYELEKLWFQASAHPVAAPEAPGPRA